MRIINEMESLMDLNEFMRLDYDSKIDYLIEDHLEMLREAQDLGLDEVVDLLNRNLDMLMLRLNRTLH